MEMVPKRSHRKCNQVSYEEFTTSEKCRKVYVTKCFTNRVLLVFFEVIAQKEVFMNENVPL